MPLVTFREGAVEQVCPKAYGGFIEQLPNSCRGNLQLRWAPPSQTFLVVVDGDTVCLIGELDVAAVPEATAFLAPADGDLKVDCSALTFLDAAGLAVLLEAHRSCQAAGVELIVIDPAPCVTRILGLMGLDQHLSIRWSREQR